MPARFFHRPSRLFAQAFFAMACAFALFSAASAARAADAQLADAQVGEAQIAQWLDQRDFSDIEASLNGLQARFERGEASEIELRNAYRVFYNLSDGRKQAMLDWERSSPYSYAMNLARGVQLKQAGLRARGNRFASETPQANIDAMNAFFDSSSKHLIASLKETPKPYLSVFHLMTITGMAGDQKASRMLLGLGNGMVPGNRLIRIRYMEFIAPKWGGSREEMRAFIEESARSGATPEGLADLQEALSSPCQCPRSAP